VARPHQRQQQSDLPLNVGFLDLLHGLVLGRRVSVLAVGVLRWDVEHQVDGLVVGARRQVGRVVQSSVVTWEAATHDRSHFLNAFFSCHRDNMDDR
jgi:hypothetical protein